MNEGVPNSIKTERKLFSVEYTYFFIRNYFARKHYSAALRKLSTGFLTLKKAQKYICI